MTMRFENQVVWLTGASSGIGEALAYALHREGASLVLSARREGELARVQADCTGGPGEVGVLAFDLTEGDRLADMAAAAQSRFGRIDMLFNNAGITHRSRVVETDLAVYRRVMEVDFFAAAALTKLVLPGMIERRHGHLVATSSVAGKYGVPHRSGYSAAKHALHGFFESLRPEAHRHDIAVSLIVAGPVRTRVSVNALTGDGGTWGRMDAAQTKGMDPAACAAAILEGLARRDEEILVGREPSIRALKVRRVLSRMVRLARQTPG